jgi:hypothetical protein
VSAGPIHRGLTASVLVAALYLGGCGGRSTEPTVGGVNGGGGDDHGPAAGTVESTEHAATTTPAGADDRSRIVRTVGLYVDSLDSGDGRTLCSLLAPRALRGIRLPVRRSGCAASLRASIGHPSPTGSPRWLGTRLVGADSVVLVDGRLGRFTGTVVHRFAGSREPSIEDDVIYLRRIGGGWRIVKPSATFYRAIGARDVPITALTPP